MDSVSDSEEGPSGELMPAEAPYYFSEKTFVRVELLKGRWWWFGLELKVVNQGTRGHLKRVFLSQAA